jgi:tuftelin-interacting protein 11
VLELEGVRQGFERGQDLINEALNLDDNERVRLPKPTFQNRPSTSSVTASAKQPRTHQTIREMVESYAAMHDVLFMPAGMVHLSSRLPMYRLTGRKDGKGGVVVYFQDDVVWAVEGGTENGTPKAISFEEMVLLAAKGR